MRRYTPTIYFTSFCLCTFWAMKGYPSDEPTWVSRPPVEDNNYRYYVGRATNTDEAEAVKEAFENAKEDAIRENFGFTTRIQSQTYEGSKDLTVTKRTDEASSNIWIKSFEQKDYYKKGNSYWILYRYSKSAISAEKARLATSPKEKSIEISESVGSSKQKGGVEIITEPDDVAIFIDNEQWGKSPQTILNKLDVGKHSLRLDHPDFNTIYEDLIISPNSNVKIKKTMLRAEGTIRISSPPLEGANVFVNGKRVGQTPMEYKLPAGIDEEVRLEHPEAEPVVTRVQVSKYETRDLNQTLLLKAGHLSINSIPIGAEIWIDGTSVGHTPIYGKPVPAGRSLQVTAKKNNFRDVTEELVLKGGEARTISIQLMSISQYEKDQAQKEEQDRKQQESESNLEDRRKERLRDPFLRLGLNLISFQSGILSNTDSATFNSGFNLQMKPTFIGLATGIDYVYGGYTYTNGSLGISGWNLLVGIPIFLSSGTYLQPDIVYTTRSYTVNNESAVINQTGYGATLGYTLWNQNVSGNERSNLGWDFKLGVHSFKGDGSIGGSTAFDLGFGIKLGF